MYSRKKIKKRHKICYNNFAGFDFMFSRFEVSILKSNQIFKYISDRLSVVFLYVLIMITFMMIPFILIERTDGVITIEERIDIIALFKDQMIPLNPNYIDGKLLIEDGFSFSYSFFEFSNQASNNPVSISVRFLEDNIQFFVSDMMYESITYETLIKTYGISLDQTSIDPLRFASLTVSWLNDLPVIVSIYYISLTLSVILEYLFITLIFTVMMRFNKKQTIKFGSHFKVGLYLTTIYGASQLLLMLFQVYSFGFISFLLTYIIYVRAYRMKGLSYE
jgi:hypothetical protein